MGKMYNLAAYDSELVLCPEAAARWVADSSVNSFSHSSGGWKVSFGSIPSGVRESLFVASLQLLGVAETLSCTQTPPSPAFVPTAFSLTVCVSVSRLLSAYKDEGPSSSRMTSAQLDCICREPVSKEGHDHRFWVDVIVGRIVHKLGQCS